MLGRLRIFRRLADVKLVGRVEVRVDISLGDFFEVEPLVVRLVDDLIVDIGEVLDVRDLIPFELEVAADHVTRDEGQHVTHVRLVLNGHSAEIHPDLAVCDRLEFDFLCALCVVNLE